MRCVEPARARADVVSVCPTASRHCGCNARGHRQSQNHLTAQQAFANKRPCSRRLARSNRGVKGPTGPNLNRRSVAFRARSGSKRGANWPFGNVPTFSASRPNCDSGVKSSEPEEPKFTADRTAVGFGCAQLAAYTRLPARSARSELSPPRGDGGAKSTGDTTPTRSVSLHGKTR